MGLPIEKVKELLSAKFSENEIEIIDAMDNGDYYNITITSVLFKGLSTIKQHQMVYGCLGSIVGNEVHSVTLKTIIKE